MHTLFVIFAQHDVSWGEQLIETTRWNETMSVDEMARSVWGSAVGLRTMGNRNLDSNTNKKALLDGKELALLNGDYRFFEHALLYSIVT